MKNWFSKVFAAASDSPEALYEQAQQAQQSGDIVKAQALYEKALQAQPAHVDAMHMLGLVTAQQGRFDQTLHWLNKAAQLQPEHASVQCNLGNVQRQLGQADLALSHYARALEIAPGMNDARLNRAELLLAMGRGEESLPDYEQVLADQPQWALAHLGLGNAYWQLNRFDEALSSFERAATCDGALAPAWNNRALVFVRLGRMQDAFDSYQRALQIDPSYLDALSNLGDWYKDELRGDEAIATYERVLALQPHHPGASLSMAMVQLQLGRYPSGWAHYESRWRNSALRASALATQAPLWMGQPVRDKTVFIHAEQGLGDTLQFVRYVPLLAERGARVVLQVQPALHGLLAQMQGASQVLVSGQAPAAYDFHCPLMSLPLAFGTDLDSIPATLPYVHAPEKASSHWGTRFQGKLGCKIGLVWSGNAQHVNDHNRSVAFDVIAQLLQEPFTWVNLQKEIRPQERAAVLAHPNLYSPGEAFESMADTSGLIAQLDLVISVDTSVAHLAAAMGKPTWILLPHCPDFRWLLARADSPWYPGAVRLYRQGTDRQWQEVIERVKRDVLLHFSQSH